MLWPPLIPWPPAARGHAGTPGEAPSHVRAVRVRAVRVRGQGLRRRAADPPQPFRPPPVMPVRNPPSVVFADCRTEPGSVLGSTIAGGGAVSFFVVRDGADLAAVLVRRDELDREDVRPVPELRVLVARVPELRVPDARVPELRDAVLREAVLRVPVPVLLDRAAVLRVPVPREVVLRVPARARVPVPAARVPVREVVVRVPAVRDVLALGVALACVVMAFAAAFIALDASVIALVAVVIALVMAVMALAEDVALVATDFIFVAAALASVAALVTLVAAAAEVRLDAAVVRLVDLVVPVRPVVLLRAVPVVLARVVPVLLRAAVPRLDVLVRRVVPVDLVVPEDLDAVPVVLRTVVRPAVLVRAALERLGAARPAVLADRFAVLLFLDVVRAAVPRPDVVRDVVLVGTDLPPRDDQFRGDLFHRSCRSTRISADEGVRRPPDAIRSWSPGTRSSARFRGLRTSPPPPADAGPV
nr:hypothetical protein GCM10010200_031180 [Actinomadura rugatobispora]